MARAKSTSRSRRPAQSARAGASESRHGPRPRPIRSASVETAIRRAFDRVRAMCLAHAGVYEKLAWSEATFRVERGKMFLMFADNHHDDGRVAFWCMASSDAREAWLGIDPDRFFVPPYVGPSGWVGVRLEGRVPWDMVAAIIAEGHRLAAPPPARRAAPGSRSMRRARSR